MKPRLSKAAAQLRLRVWFNKAMDETLTCHQCGNSFIGQYNGANFDKYCSTKCKNIVQAQVDTWTYSGAWLNDLSALTGAIAAQQGRLSTEIVADEAKTK